MPPSFHFTVGMSITGFLACSLRALVSCHVVRLGFRGLGCAGCAGPASSFLQDGATYGEGRGGRITGDGARRCVNRVRVCHIRCGCVSCDSAGASDRLQGRSCEHAGRGGDCRSNQNTRRHTVPARRCRNWRTRLARRCHWLRRQRMHARSSRRDERSAFAVRETSAASSQSRARWPFL